VLGLAILIPLSAARTETLARTIPADAALVEGFRVAFLGAVAIAACGIATSILLTGKKDQIDESKSQQAKPKERSMSKS
jgi:hypothetical protein